MSFLSYKNEFSGLVKENQFLCIDVVISEYQLRCWVCYTEKLAQALLLVSLDYLGA